MSKYSEISKRLGWDGERLDIPSIAEAKRLLEGVRAENVESFEAVFRLHRFMKWETTPKEEEALGIISEAFKIGTEIFNK